MYDSVSCLFATFYLYYGACSLLIKLKRAAFTREIFQAQSRAIRAGKRRLIQSMSQMKPLLTFACMLSYSPSKFCQAFLCTIAMMFVYFRFSKTPIVERLYTAVLAICCISRMSSEITSGFFFFTGDISLKIIALHKDNKDNSFRYRIRRVHDLFAISFSYLCAYSLGSLFEV